MSLNRSWLILVAVSIGLSVAAPTEYKSVSLKGGSIKLSKRLKEDILLQHQTELSAASGLIGKIGGLSAQLERHHSGGWTHNAPKGSTTLLAAGTRQVNNTGVRNSSKNISRTVNASAAAAAPAPKPAPADQLSPEDEFILRHDDKCAMLFSLVIHTYETNYESCIAVEDIFKELEQSSGPQDGLAALERLCTNVCFNEMTEHFMVAKDAGCNEFGSGDDIDALVQTCSVSSCEAPEPSACVNTWIAEGCPPHPPYPSCEPYGHCATKNFHKCPGGHTMGPESQPVDDKVVLTFLLPIDMELDDFHDRHIGNIVQLLSQVSGESVSQISLLDLQGVGVSEGGPGVVVSVLVSAEQHDSAIELLHRLETAIEDEELVRALQEFVDESITIVHVIELVAVRGQAPELPIEDTPPPINADDGVRLNRYENVNKHLPDPDVEVSNVTGRSFNATAASATASSSPIPSLAPSPSPIAIVDGGNASYGYKLEHNYTCSGDCSGHGKCVSDDVCECSKGYGELSSNETQCSTYLLDLCPSECFGHGVCNPNNRNCLCFEGFFGETCSTYKRCEDLDFCSGHGRCTKSSNGNGTNDEKCICFEGYTGQRCEIMHVACPFSCSGHGRCDVANGRKCICDEGYEGEDCGLVSEPYCRDHCSGNGKCGAGANCSCAEGWVGISCNIAISMPGCEGGCAHGYCQGGKCQCEEGFTGDRCDTYDASSDSNCAALNFCHGYGICERGVSEITGAASFRCECFEGFSGSHCGTVDVDYENLCPSHCGGHGKCVLVPSPHCECKPGWKGDSCNVSLCNTEFNGRVCSGHGICELVEGKDGVGECKCDAGYNSGVMNACELSACPDDCSGRGRCLANGTCLCNAGFSGDACKTATKAMNAKVSVSKATKLVQAPSKSVSQALVCLHGGSLADGACKCKRGWEGKDCSVSKFVDAEEELPELDNMEDFLEINEDTAPADHQENMAALWE